jgi:hypothetical protein
MRRIGLSIVGAVALLALAASAFATPSPNSAVIIERVFNDCPATILTTVNNYPAQIIIDDVNAGCVGFANLHVWRFSEDGSNPAIFSNGDAFRFCATLLITGTGQCEAGLQVRPWWSVSDGRLNVRTTDGEIACFGGRLPFYSFTGSHGLHYVKGTSIYLEIIYLPNGLSMASPATIEYKLTYNSVNYTSGPLAFDEGNPAEDPPHGLWGILTPAQVGGHDQFFVGQSGPTGNARVEWDDICYEALTVAVEQKSWEQIKSLYR